MPSYIPDGYQLDGYIAPEVDEKGHPFYESLSFRYRPAARMESIEYDSRINAMNRNGDDPRTAVEMEKMACKFVADHLISWDMKNTDGAALPPTAQIIEYVQHKLFRRLWGIIRGTQLPDFNPALSKQPETQSDLAKN